VDFFFAWGVYLPKEQMPKSAEGHCIVRLGGAGTKDDGVEEVSSQYRAQCDIVLLVVSYALC